MGNGISMYAFGPDSDIAAKSLFANLIVAGYNMQNLNLETKTADIVYRDYTLHYKFRFTKRDNIIQANVEYVSGAAPPVNLKELSVQLFFLVCLLFALYIASIYK